MSNSEEEYIKTPDHLTKPKRPRSEAFSTSSSDSPIPISKNTKMNSITLEEMEKLLDRKLQPINDKLK